MDNIVEYIGFAAAAGTTLSFFPQAYKTITTQDTKGISFWMYILFTIGVFLWLLYGILLSNLPMIFANTITSVLALIILSIKIKNIIGKKE